MKFIYTFIAALYLMPLCILGQPDNTNCSTLVIDDFPTFNSCDTSALHNGLTYLITDGSNICYLNSDGTFGGHLEIDLSPLNGVTQVVIELMYTDADVTLHAGNTIINSESPFPIYTLNNPQNLNIDKLSIQGYMIGIVSITIEYNCAPACDPKIQVESEQGDVYIDDPCYGAILTSPNGSCFRVKVTDSGALVTEAVACP